MYGIKDYRTVKLAKSPFFYQLYIKGMIAATYTNGIAILTYHSYSNIVSNHLQIELTFIKTWLKNKNYACYSFLTLRTAGLAMCNNRIPQRGIHINRKLTLTGTH